MTRLWLEKLNPTRIADFEVTGRAACPPKPSADAESPAVSFGGELS
jgi:hypothetical protein